MALNEPAHHCGGLFTWAPADALELNFGLVAGPDVSWQNYRGDSGILFGVTLNLNERLSLTYASELCQIHSEMGENRTAQSWGYYLLNGDSIGDQNEYLQTVTAEIELTDQLAYAFVTNYGSMEDRATRTRRYAQYGFANYLTYDLAESLSTSLRYEYYLQQVKTSGAEGRYHDLSFALKYRPAKDVFILPEIRYDWADLAGDKNNGVTGAVAFGVVF